MSTSPHTREYDYIIVGAGSAGCVLANRLSEDSDCRVLLLEAGPADRSIFIHMPAALSISPGGTRFNWAYLSEPEKWMDDRRMDCPRGRVLGGSSSINAMVYIRGIPLDYDLWAAQGLPEWDYAQCLPYFRRSEHHELGGDSWHGSDGPLRVTAGRTDHPLCTAWMEAARQAGLPISADVNGGQPEGVSRFDRTCWGGERWSTAKGYLAPVRQRPNLTVLTGILARRILFENHRAIGVEWQQGRSAASARVSREVIISGGAINSPQLLLLSGIGGGEALKRHGIPVVRDLPGVGENLQDHLEFCVQYACLKPISLFSAMQMPGRLKVGLEWLLFRRGPGATNHFEAGGFLRSNPAETHPNLQYHFLPGAVNMDGRPVGVHGFQAHMYPSRPLSRGHVRLRSSDPADPPKIVFNYMSEERDRRETREAVRLTREIFSQKAFDPWRGRELTPGPDAQSDADIDAVVRRRAETGYHPSCTCRMGTSPEAGAVVDAAGRVHGMESLRVVDASIMPDIISGNLNAATIMIAEKISDMIRGRRIPPAESA